MTSVAAVRGARLARARRGRGARFAAVSLWVWRSAVVARMRGAVLAAGAIVWLVALASWRPTDPCLDVAAGGAVHNLMGVVGADVADLSLQTIGVAAAAGAALALALGVARVRVTEPAATRATLRRRALAGAGGVIALSVALAGVRAPSSWPFARGLGGVGGDAILNLMVRPLSFAPPHAARLALVILALALAAAGLGYAFAVRPRHLASARAGLERRVEALIAARRAPDPVAPAAEAAPPRRRRAKPSQEAAVSQAEPIVASAADAPIEALAETRLEVQAPTAATRTSAREARESQKTLPFTEAAGFQLPELAMLAKPKPRSASHDEAALRQNARLLETVLGEFGVKGVIDQIRPGPVVTLYELVPAAGVKSSRVIALADDIARSMSARSARVSVVPGRNAIGIELPNAHRETVYLRDLLSSGEYDKATSHLPMALGETIGGEPYIADLARMPHLLIAGTTGSGKSVGVNAMILSILYRLTPDQCRFIMIDPKMLELSVYDGIPHLLAPVVTDPKKAIVALKWTVREMENRYRLMSKIGVRNIGGYNDKAREATAKGEHFERTVQTGFDDAGRPTYESEKIRPEPMPFLVVVIDEVADLMMVAGKDIEGAVQRLAQMARAAGIHLIMATQRPSVDVITGTIKANFPTRISFQVTSKIDARTILGEQGAEQLLGQGDMLYMAGGGRVTRLHGPFVSDGEVEAVARYLRDQGQPQYLEEVTAAPEEDEDGAGDTGGAGGGGGEGGSDLYDQAVAVVTRDRKASTSYVQRRLQIGYNRAASLIERMEKEGVVTAANHSGKRDILVGPPPV